jgi:hypothetical protein
VTETLSELKVSSFFEAFSVNQTYPFTISTYAEKDDTMCDVSFYVASHPKDYFLPEVMDAGSTLGLSTRLPNFFRRSKRVLETNRRKPGFNENTSQAQGFMKTCEGIDKCFGFKDVIFSDPQMIVLPFTVEERIVEWEIQGTSNNLGSLIDDLGGQQCHYCVYTKLRKLKVKKRTAGTFRITTE